MQKQLFFGFIALTLSFFTACEKPSLQEEPSTQLSERENADLHFDLGKDFWLDFGKVAACNCDAPNVRFQKLIDDSRCPLNAMCVWQGLAEVQLLVGSDTLVLNTDQAQVKSLNGYRYRLLEVMPYPIDPSPYTERDYKIRLQVEQE